MFVSLAVGSEAARGLAEAGMEAIMLGLGNDIWLTARLWRTAKSDGP
ncbi:MAG TPA: hypothetical protein VFV58_39920 [Blastocatellia bacterium]|nr:hypothetical protein [Blastocatellia bacterium]